MKKYQQIVVHVLDEERMKGRQSMKKERQTETSEFEERITAAWLAGARSVYTRNQFKNQMLAIGLAKYEKVILPIEMGERPASEPAQGIKIISFPGGSA